MCSRATFAKTRILLFLLPTLLLFGCGQKGALYLPEDEPAAATRYGHAGFFV